MTGAAQPLHIFIVATEESGDKLGGALMQAIKARADRPVIFSGVGSTAMQAEGLSSQFPISELAIIGIDAVIAKLPTILRLIRETAAKAIAARPDMLVIIDSPDFTHRVARKVRAALPDLPIVDYVSPTVWAWRPGRARTMRAYVDHLLALLPFEPKVHQDLGGPPCTYVGHPLRDRLDELRPGAEDAARRNAKPPVLLVLPGSRTGEVTRLLAPFGETVRQTAAQCGPLDVVVPTVPHVAERVRAAVAGWGVPARVTLDPAEKALAFRTARAALAASGTVTLELAVAGIPTVVAYKISMLEEIIGHLFVRTPSIVLANLVLGENIMPEIVQRGLTPENLAAALVPLIEDTPARQRQMVAFGRIDAIMGIGRAPAGIQAADIVLALARSRNSNEKPT
jgi:lipid-A-disaccharide synthase